MLAVLGPAEDLGPGVLLTVVGVSQVGNVGLAAQLLPAFLFVGI